MIKRVLKHLIKELIIIVMDKSLPPPTDQEMELIEELRDKFRILQLENSEKNQPIEKVWDDNLNRLNELVLIDNPRTFLRWDVIRKTMFVNSALYVWKELQYLKNLSNWNERWSNAIVEATIGHPCPFALYPTSSGNLIHHAFHLAQFEEKTGSSVNNLNFVLEFGGGYGSMCRLFHNLQFGGRYIIYDLPEFSALQEYYLKAVGIDIQSVRSFMENESGVVCLSDIEELKRLISHFQIRKDPGSLFLGTWSLSEVPIKFRNSIIPLVSNFNNLLIAYQNEFGAVDNIQYFNGIRDKSEFSHIGWFGCEIKHLPKNYYLIGSTSNVREY